MEYSIFNLCFKICKRSNDYVTNSQIRGKTKNSPFSQKKTSTPKEKTQHPQFPDLLVANFDLQPQNSFVHPNLNKKKYSQKKTKNLMLA